MLVIDRIEGGAAVCEGEDRAMREIPLDLLPQGAAEGDVLREGPEGLEAVPIRGKSGLITTLAGADGYFCISRDCEGFPAGTQVSVTIFTTD